MECSYQNSMKHYERIHRCVMNLQEMKSCILQRHMVVTSKISAIRNLFLAKHRPSIFVSTYLPPLYKCNELQTCVLPYKWHNRCKTKIVSGDHPISIIQNSGWQGIRKKENKSVIKTTATVFQKCVVLVKSRSISTNIRLCSQQLDGGLVLVMLSLRQGRQKQAHIKVVLTTELVCHQYHRPAL